MAHKAQQPAVRPWSPSCTAAVPWPLLPPLYPLSLLPCSSPHNARNRRSRLQPKPSAQAAQQDDASPRPVPVEPVPAPTKQPRAADCHSHARPRPSCARSSVRPCARAPGEAPDRAEQPQPRSSRPNRAIEARPRAVHFISALMEIHCFRYSLPHLFFLEDTPLMVLIPTVPPQRPSLSLSSLYKLGSRALLLLHP